VEDGAAGVVTAGNLRVHGSPGQRFEVAFDGLDERAHVDLAVFDVRGRRVATLDHRHQGGTTVTITATWDGMAAGGRPAPQGVYFVRLVAQGTAHAVKVVLSR
jgi:flagellar hook assembly protein FlgD